MLELKYPISFFTKVPFQSPSLSSPSPPPQRELFLSNLDAFIQALQELLNSAVAERRRQTNSGVQVRVIEESIEELPNGNLEFSVIAQSEGGGVVDAAVLENVVEDNGATLAQDVCNMIGHCVVDFCMHGYCISMIRLWVELIYVHRLSKSEI